MLNLLPLHDFWALNGARFIQERGWNLPDYLGENADRDLARISGDGGIFDLSFRGKVRITGKDRVDFLHRLLTQDIKNLRAGQGIYTAFLNRTGHAVAEGFLLAFDDFLIWDMEMNQARKAILELEKFVIMEDVHLADESGKWIELGLSGENVLASCETAFDLRFSLKAAENREEGLKATPRELGFAASLKSPEILSVSQNFLPWPNHWLLAPVSAKPAILQWLGSMAENLAGYAAYASACRAHGSLRYGWDFDETNLFPETGLDLIACSSTKGCYPGQEVVARYDTYKRGKPK